MKRLAFGLLTLFACTTAWGARPAKGKVAAFSVSAGDITDRRRNDGFFSGLEVVMKLQGEALESVKGLRATTKVALDDTGRSLLSEEKRSTDFDKPSGDAPEVKLSLKNPARRATNLKEVSGQLEIFIPSRDPQATASAESFLSRLDKPLASPALKSAQVEVTVVSRKSYDEEKKKDEERKKKESDSDGIAGKMAEAFAGLFSGMMGDIGENDVLIRVNDPGKRVFGIEIVDSSGKRIEDRGSMKMSGFWIVNFHEPLPKDAALRVYVLTPKSLVTLPFFLKNVTLP